MSPVNTDTSFIENRAPNVAVQFRDRVHKSPSSEAYSYPAADGEPWTTLTWKQTGDTVEKLAAGLLALGLESEQRVGIAAATRVEWIFADLAIMCAGGATTTVYPSTHATDVAYIVSDSECRVVFAEDESQVAKLKEHRSELPHLEKVVLFDGTPDEDWVISLDDLSALGEKHLAEKPQAVTEAIDAIQPEQLATLVYTSGTTGQPKGVRLRHSSWTYEGAAIQAQQILDERDLQFLWLPMAHVFGKVLLSTQLACGFATAVDGRVDKIIENLAIVQPTFMGAAPRIFEKAHARIVTMQAAEGGLQGEDLPEGLQGRSQGRCPRARGQVGVAAAQGPARDLRPAGVLEDPRHASEAGCGSSSPVPPRSTATSPSGSTPPASSSSRATG